MEAKQILNVKKLREDFPIINEKLSYLDSSATSLTPNQVLESLTDYYTKYNSNIHRGVYELSQKATEEYELAHKKVAEFINADLEEIVFTKNTSESLNLLAYTLTKRLNKGDEILLTEMEHHSNLVPWQQLSKEKELVLKFIPVNSEGKLDLQKVEDLISEKTKIVSVTHMSNVLGTINPVKEIGKLAHAKGALFVIDGAQSVPHFEVDIKDIDCDFLAFSGHKMLGPTGIGVLYGKKDLLESLDPFMYGGDMISEVYFQDSKWNELPWKFEAGTPNIAGGIALGRAVDYLRNIGMKSVREYEEHLTEYALEKLSGIENMIIYGPKSAKERGGVISFNIKGVHPHDVSTILDRHGVAVRGGHMCAMPLVTDVLDAGGSVCRASFYIYNTTEEIDKLVEGLQKVKEVFKND
jgi:cysteine desulfurase / selenocysteine lyase